MINCRVEQGRGSGGRDNITAGRLTFEPTVVEALDEMTWRITAICLNCDSIKHINYKHLHTKSLNIYTIYYTYLIRPTNLTKITGYFHRLSLSPSLPISL